MRAFGAVQAFIKNLVRLHKEFLEFGRVFQLGHTVGLDGLMCSRPLGSKTIIGRVLSHSELESSRFSFRY